MRWPSAPLGLALLLSFVLISVASPAQNPSVAAASSASNAPDLGTVSLEDLMDIKVYSASRYLQSPSEAAGTVSIVTRTEIERYGYRTLADALRSVPGPFVSYDRVYSYVGVRGFGSPGDYNTRVLLMIDGHRLNDAVFQQAMFGTEFPVDIDLVERIEVIRGPASSIYGTNAVFAVINVITRKAGELRGVEVSADGGSFNSYRGRLSYGGNVHGVAVVLSGTLYGSKGAHQLYFPAYADSPTRGVSIDGDGDGFNQFFANIGAKGFVFESIYGRRDKHDPTGAWDAVFNDPRNRAVDTHALTDLKYERALSPTWELMARTYFDRYEYDGFYPISSDDPSGTVLNRDAMTGERWGVQGQVSKLLRGKHHLIAGIEYRRAFDEHLFAYDVDPPFTYQNANFPAWIAAGYFQGEFDFANRFHLTLGIRNDYGVQYGNSLNPRVSIAYRPWNGGNLKLTYGTAFRSPNTYELFYAGYGAVPALHLVPERIRSFEGGFEQRLNSVFSLNATGFHTRMLDFISLTEDAGGLLTYRNVKHAASSGMELGLIAKSHNGLLASASYSYQNAEDPFSNQWLVGSPHHIVQGNISGPLLQTGLTAGLELQYLSRRPTLAGSYVPPYAVVNATLLRKNIGGRLDLSATIYNLLNSAVYDPGAQQHQEDMLQQPGRAFRVKLTLHLGDE